MQINQTQSKILSILILVLGIIWIWLSAAPPGSTTSGQIPAPQKGFQAPDFSLPTADGQVITLSNLRGQPVLINIWASWCAPCRAEMPAMQRVYRDYFDAEGNPGFTILAVNATNQDNANEAIAFAQDFGLSFPILFDQRGDVSRAYEVRALPTSYFVDAQGIIQDVVVGGPMSEALLRVRVEELFRSSEGGR